MILDIDTFDETQHAGQGIEIETLNELSKGEERDKNYLSYLVR